MREQLTEKWIKETEQKMSFIVSLIHPRKEKESKYDLELLFKKVGRLIYIRNFCKCPEEKKLIRDFYKSCPKGWSVDHIFPLSLGGPHTLSNLQWIPLKENMKKGNRPTIYKRNGVECLPYLENDHLKFIHPPKIRKMRRL